MFNNIFREMLKKIKKRFGVYIVFCIINFFIIDFCSASDIYSRKTSHYHNEDSYKHVWCLAHNGIEEFENKDKTRVDCLTQTHAIEFDFANKWAESVGQALYYSYMTGKRGKVVLILENLNKEMIYYNRVKCLGYLYNFDVEFITMNSLNLVNGKCHNPKCKCHKTINN